MKFFATLFRTSIIAALMGLMFGAVAAEECPLCDAAISGDVAEVKRLLVAEADMNEIWNDFIESNRELDRECPLCMSAMFGDVARIKQKLAAGADVNHANPGGWTALMMAARQGRAEAAKVLLHAGANPDMKNHEGKTAWDYIKGKKRMEYVFERAIKEWYEKQ